MQEFGVRWREFDRHDRLVNKVMIFSTAKARDNFVEKIQKKSNFYRIEAWLN